MSRLGELAMNDATVRSVLGSGGTHTDCIAALVAQKRQLIGRIRELEESAENRKDKAA